MILHNWSLRPMRFHVVGLPHTQTTKAFCACAYTQNVLNFCKMMRALGHEVFHYGAAGSTPDCTEHVTVVSTEEQIQWFGTVDHTQLYPVCWQADKPYWQVMNARAAREIEKRLQPRDFVCLIGGYCQKDVADHLEGSVDIAVVEYGIGYYGAFSRFKVFPSYTHQSAFYGTRSSDPDVHLYDAVIPHYFDPEDFVSNGEKQRARNYLLYVGRIIKRKGLDIAVEVARHCGLPLLVAGQGVIGETETSWLSNEVILPKSVCKYVGSCDVPGRQHLMRNALALLAPSTYLEPFGMVAVEAQLCGTPAITTDFGGFVETVRHGYSGWRCHTLGQFVQAVGHLKDLQWNSDQIVFHAMREYSLKTVQAKYNEYFNMVYSLWDDGWYTQSSRDQLSWLMRMA